MIINYFEDYVRKAIDHELPKHGDSLTREVIKF